ncbi:hypothetical protein RRG08_029533 [Elysia crispata]|uniref:Uncharacterized protein n=1 Tax=Elysia crispata TaxID=231223 RepID=A0AAE1CMZ2_9GAST|nr:hypothetical protein RRG08_029533 [Elysia crispata]
MKKTEQKKMLYNFSPDFASLTIYSERKVKKAVEARLAIQTRQALLAAGDGHEFKRRRCDLFCCLTSPLCQPFVFIRAEHRYGDRFSAAEESNIGLVIGNGTEEQLHRELFDSMPQVSSVAGAD